MSFLFPSFLWGLLAVLVPVAIHFFNFRRTRRVYFTKVAFLKDVKTQTSSFRKLKHWLVLLARVLAVASLVFAFAQPFIPGEGVDKERRSGVTGIYIDNSFSMQSEENNKRYLDIATGRLSELLGLFRSGSSLQLVTNDFSAQEQGLSPADKIRDRLTTINLSHTPRTLSEVYRRQQNLLSRYAENGQSQLFWFSDFQKSTVGDLGKLSIDSSSQLTIVPVQAVAERNVFVDSVWLNTPFIRELQNNILHVKLSNSGKESIENQVVKLSIDGQQVSTASVNLAADGNAIAHFNFSIKGRGFRRGQITFDDFPVTFDNDYYFVLNASPVIRIVHLYGGVTPNNFISNVYANDSLFSLKSFNVRNMDVGTLSSADLILLEEVAEPSGALSSALNDFVKKGGSLAVIPPVTLTGNSYSSLLSNFGIIPSVLTLGPNPELIPMNTPDRNHSFFSDVFEVSVREETNLNLPTALALWQWNTGATLLSLRNGQRYLSVSGIGKGKVYIWSAPLGLSYSTIGQHALFVPVMYKMAAMSVRSQQTAYSFGDKTVSLLVENPSPNAIYKLRKGKTELIPVQRLNGNQVVMELPKADQLVADQSVGAGYYELLRENKVEQLIAINHDNSESKLDYYSPEELRTAFSGKKNVRVFDKVDDAKFVREFERQNMGTSLWRYFLYAALAFFLLEIVLIRYLKN